MCENHRWGTAMVLGWSETWRCIFPRWQPRQLCATAVTSLPVLGQQNDAFTSLVVAVPRRLFFAAQQRIDVN
jgi:hypothetical protein